MSARKVKFKFTVKELSFEFEGDQDMGQSVQRNISRTLERLSQTQNDVMGIEDQHEALPHNPNVVDSVATPAKRRRRRTGSSSNGNGEKKDGRSGARPGSARYVIEQLISEGFFASEKLLGEVVDAMAAKGKNSEPKDVSKALLELVQSTKLSRKKNAEDVWVYYNPPQQ